MSNYVPSELSKLSLEYTPAQLAPGEFDGGLLILRGQVQPLMQLLLKIAVADLLQYVCIPGFIDLERLSAVRGR